MFADSGAPLPPGVRSSRPRRSRAAIVRAIERNRAEVDAAPFELRAGARLAGVAPGLAADVNKRVGTSIARSVEQGRGDRASVPAGMAVQTRPRGVTLLVASPGAGADVHRARGRCDLAAVLHQRATRQGRGRAHDRRGDQQPRGLRRDVAIVLATRALPRARARLRALGGVPSWYFLGGLRGSGARAGLGRRRAGGRRGAADRRAGLRLDGRQPAGRRRRARAGGTAARSRSRASRACCSPIIATVISAPGARGHPDVLLLALALGGGPADVAPGGGQRAARARDGRAVGGLAGQRHPRFRDARRRRARARSRRRRSTACRAIRCSTAAACSAHSWSWSPPPPCRRSGVLRLGLAMVAGQTHGSAGRRPDRAGSPGEAVTAATVIGVVLTMVAVAVSGRGQRDAPAREALPQVPEAAR